VTDSEVLCQYRVLETRNTIFISHGVSEGEIGL